MARIVFTSGAYLGDVAPFVEPANRLVARGHEVTFVLPVGFHPLLGDEAFDVVPYPLDFSPSGMGSDPMHERLLRHPVANQARLARYWMRRGFVDGPDVTRDALLHVLDGADVLVTHPTLGAASVPVAQHLGVPVGRRAAVPDDDADLGLGAADRETEPRPAAADQQARMERRSHGVRGR